ncbi:Circumsporozoite protein [Ilyonectria robusta]
MKKGWTWESLGTGSFDTWNGWNFAGGWSCQSSSKRGLNGRTFGKAISSHCGHDVSSAPSFNCGSKSGISSFSVSTFHVSVEFDCRLELHYEMQDGSLCRQSHQCSSGSYNIITNTQCGGAKRVSFVYPKQGKEKDKSKDTTTNQQSTTTHTSSSHTRSTAKSTQTTSSSKPLATTNENIGEKTRGYSTPHVVTYNSTSTVYTLTTHAATSHGTGISNRTTESHPVVVTESVAVSTIAYRVTDTVTYPGASETPLTRLGSSAGTHIDTKATKATIATSYSSTSTIYATSLRTISSCDSEVAGCSGASGSPVVVTETIAVGTTVVSTAETRINASDSPSSPTHPNTNVSPSSRITGEDHPATPTSSYDVPDVVPGCINTFLDSVKDCRDNTDAACYCPDQTFVNNVFQCLYAHGESDDVVAKAISFFQGICVGYVSENPAVYTGAESVTSIITVTGTTVIVSAPYTTVTVHTTITQPFVDTGGSTIAVNGTAMAIYTEYAVPEIGFTTGPSGGVNVVPPATAGPAVPNTLYPTVTSTLAGTGNYAVPTATSPGEALVTGGAAQAVVGYAAAIFAAVLAL